jgi:hypothetical protein
VEFGAGEQRDDLVPQDHSLARVQRLPGKVRRLVHPRKRRVRAGLRPQRVDDAVPVQSPAGCQGKELHQGRGLPAPPLVGRDRHAVDADGEAAQESYLDPHRWSLLPAQQPQPGAGNCAGPTAGQRRWRYGDLPRESTNRHC